MIFGDFFRVTPKSRRVKLKHKKGVLFSNPGGLKRTVFYIGNCLLIVAIVGGVYLYYPLGRAVFKYWMSQKQQANITQTEILPTPTPIQTENKIEEYTISIPKILAYAKVVDNVSPYDRDKYLKILEDNVVAQSEGSAQPGSGVGNMTYIFAHSTSQGINMLRNNAVFYLLGEMKNDDVIFINKNGIVYTYRVYQQLVVGANQTEYLEYTDPDKEVLILQTCWPIGTNWKRLLILANRV